MRIFQLPSLYIQQIFRFGAGSHGVDMTLDADCCSLSPLQEACEENLHNQMLVAIRGTEDCHLTDF